MTNSPFQEKFLNVLYRNDSSMFTDQHCNLDFYLHPEIEIKEFFKRMTWRMHNLGYTVNLLSKVGLSILHTLCSVLFLCLSFRPFISRPLHGARVGCKFARQMILSSCPLAFFFISINNATKRIFKKALLEPNLSNFERWCHVVPT